MRPRTAPLTLLALAALASCGASAGERATLVFASASLTEAFQALEVAFEQQHPDTALDLHYAGTPQLVMQVRQGAPVGVFAAADEPSLRRALGATAAAPRVFATNHLAIAVAQGNPRGITGLADLARADLKVALCGPDVPAGRYARQALARAGVIVASVSDEPSVKAVLSKVCLGELDAGVVYATDLACAGIGGVAVAAEHDVVASYPIAVLDADDAGARAFVAFVLSEQGQSVLRSFGFGAP